MSIPAHSAQALLEKIQALPPERVSEVEDFVDFLSQRNQDKALTQAALAAAEPVLAQVWDNPDDAEYDQL